MRKKIPEDEKRKNLSFSLNPVVYKLYKKYCEDKGIENYSQHLEKLILKKLEENEQKS
jgi:hypothetical protein